MGTEASKGKGEGMTPDTSALDWRPGPKIRAAQEQGATVHMVRDHLGGWGLTVRRAKGRPLLTAGTTPQEAADRMEERL